MTPVPTSRYVAFGLIAATGLLADLSSKSRVFAALGYPQRGTEPFFEGAVTFRLYTSLNEGALWGMGQGYAWLFAALSLVAVIGVVYWLFFRGAAVSWWLTVSLALIMSGTLGNLYDRLALHGCVHPVDDQPWHAVRDFLHFQFQFGALQYDWPVFNFADVFLVTGAVMLVLHSFQPEPQPQTVGEGQSAGNPPAPETNAVRAATG